MSHRKDLRWFALAACALLCAAFAAGCGTTVKREATEQLLSSDAIDRTVSQIDFGDLSGKKVYFDTQYIPNVKGAGFVNSEYIISSLRQQLIASNCRLQEKLEDADYVVEARIGALGTDSHEIIVGLPANNFVNSAASVLTAMPQLPAIPEIALAKKNGQLAAAKIGVFAYDRRTKRPVWQSGIAQARSTSRDTWLFGAGPFQRGSIYRGTRFAGSKIDLPLVAHDEPEGGVTLATYEDELHFAKPPQSAENAAESEPASAAEPQLEQTAAPTEQPPGAQPENANTPAESQPATQEPPKQDAQPKPDANPAMATGDSATAAPPAEAGTQSVPASTPAEQAAKPAAMQPDPRLETTTEPRNLLGGGGFLRIIAGGNRWLRLTDGSTGDPYAGD